MHVAISVIKEKKRPTKEQYLHSSPPPASHIQIRFFQHKLLKNTTITLAQQLNTIVVPTINCKLRSSALIPCRNTDKNSDFCQRPS